MIKVFKKIFNKLLREIIFILEPMVVPKKGRIYFSSFGGRYSDSPKQIAQLYAIKHPQSEISFSVDKRHLQFTEPYVNPIIAGSWKDAWYKCTANVLVDNGYGGKSIWLHDNNKKSLRKFRREYKRKYKRDQTLITTWHGTPLKRMGIDAAGSTIIDFDCPNTIMVLGNRFTSEVMKRLTFDKIPMKLIGTPRNDPLCNLSISTNENLKRRMGLPLEKKILLYAPTFRDANGEGSKPDIRRSGLDQIEQIDLYELINTLSNRFGGEWILVLRFHNYVDEKIDWNHLNNLYGEKIINGNKWDDMVDYLSVCDALLTDASSCMFDMGLTNKPCFLFFPDVDRYTRERGLYFKWEDIPFPLADNFELLLWNINNFDEFKYNQKRTRFLEAIGNVDDGHATERVCDFIYSIVSSENN